MWDDRIILREYRPENCPALAELFYQTVHTINARDYSDEQLNAWAPGMVDLAVWNRSFMDHYTVVAEVKGILVGFGDIGKTGYLDRLYVHKEYQRQGIAAMLCDRLESKYDVEFIETHASITARPFFERRGYELILEQEVERNGVKLTNYVMRKPSLKDNFF